MGNRVDKLFFRHDSSYERHSMNKINWRCYLTSVFVSVISVISLVLAGIFCSAMFDSVISMLVLGILAVMSAMDYQ